VLLLPYLYGSFDWFKFIVIAISGKCESVLFGDYVDEVNKKIGKSAVG
jgi:hypothetical protein